MIFGFNTDVKHGETVYHVMSEPRADDLLLQTIIYVRGAIVGKRAWSYASFVMRPDFSNEAMHELLKEQHRKVVQGIREGKLATILGDTNEITDTGGDLSVRCLDPDGAYFDGVVKLRFAVTSQSTAVKGARVHCALGVAPVADATAEADTDESGTAEIQLPLERIAPGDFSLMIRATDGPRSVTRKLRLRRSS